MSLENQRKVSIHIKMKDFLLQWDNASKKLRGVILERFIKHFSQHSNKNNIYQLNKELGEITPLFFSRIMSSFQINNMKMNLIPKHIDCILIYLKSQNGKQYTERFINSGGIQLIINIVENKDCSKDLQYKCLLIIKLIIQINCNFKEIICMNGGVELLLNIIVNNKNENDNDLFYYLYDILKQLCIRNHVYTPSIHQSIIYCIRIQANSDMDKDEAIKTLLKVLQSTITFEDDIRIISIQNKNENVSENVMNSNNICIIIRLLELKNHQIIHELQNLCNVILRSHKAQTILLQSLIELMIQSNKDIKKEYVEFIQNLVDRNKDILCPDSKQMLMKNKIIKCI